MKTIPLTKGYSALVDDEDYERVAAVKWYASVHPRTIYAQRDCHANGKRTAVCLHRFIMSAPQGMWVDHINGDGLDNRKSNLRVCTPAENLRNQRRPTGRSVFKGISFDAVNKKWRATIRVSGKRVFLGRFLDERSAAMAYDAAALLHHGAFACTNADLGLL